MSCLHYSRSFLQFKKIHLRSQWLLVLLPQPLLLLTHSILKMKNEDWGWAFAATDKAAWDIQNSCPSPWSENWLLHFSSGQPANAHPGKQQVVALVCYPHPPMWEIEMEFQGRGYSLGQPYLSETFGEWTCWWKICFCFSVSFSFCLYTYMFMSLCASLSAT